MMRRAALDAGLFKEESSASLVLCLEPEAACIACEQHREEIGHGRFSSAAANNLLKTGDTFMVYVTRSLRSCIHAAVRALALLSYIVFASQSLTPPCFSPRWLTIFYSHLSLSDTQTYCTGA